MYTLPSLELTLAQKLEEGLTFPWSWSIDAAQLSRLCAIDPQGQLALVSTLLPHDQPTLSLSALDPASEE